MLRNILILLYINKFFKCLLVAGIVAVSGYGINKSADNSSTNLSDLTLANIEALAQSETSCTSSSSENTGTCRAKVDGTGDVCVTADFWDSKNCIK